MTRSRVSCGLSSWPLIVLHHGWSWDAEDDHDLVTRSGTWKTDLKVWDVRWPLKGGRSFLKMKEEL